MSLLEGEGGYIPSHLPQTPDEGRRKRATATRPCTSSLSSAPVDTLRKCSS